MQKSELKITVQHSQVNEWCHIIEQVTVQGGNPIVTQVSAQKAYGINNVHLAHL